MTYTSPLASGVDGQSADLKHVCVRQQRRHRLQLHPPRDITPHLGGEDVARHRFVGEEPVGVRVDRCGSW